MAETTIKKVQMSNADIQKVSAPILAAMNAAQYEPGRTIDEVLMATAYVLGGAIAQRGGVLLLDTPLRRALPPLVSGYENMLKQLSKGKEGKHGS